MNWKLWDWVNTDKFRTPKAHKFLRRNFPENRKINFKNFPSHPTSRSTRSVDISVVMFRIQASVRVRNSCLWIADRRTAADPGPQSTFLRWCVPNQSNVWIQHKSACRNISDSTWLQSDRSMTSLARDSSRHHAISQNLDARKSTRLLSRPRVLWAEACKLFPDSVVHRLRSTHQIQDMRMVGAEPNKLFGGPDLIWDVSHGLNSR